MFLKFTQFVKNYCEQITMKRYLSFFIQYWLVNIQNMSRNILIIQRNPKRVSQGKYKMNEKDFKGIYKWKFLIPGLYIISWLLMIFGPLFFPFGYQIYCIIIVVYSLLKTLGLSFGTLVAMLMQTKTLKILQQRKEDLEKNQVQNGILVRQTRVYHAIIIPSYKEDQEVLLQTLDVLARNQFAKTQFIIILAMEAHQKNSDQKAKSIINKCKEKFLYMGFTLHLVRQGQYKGKASNVSWSAEHLQQTIPSKLNINLDKLMVTIVDADSWIPVQFFQKIEIELENKPQIFHRSMFCAPQIYTRNHLDVPVFNRTFDIMHSIAHLANMVGIHYLFPLSNYSLSYNLAKKIQWWDTCADAIGEDFHTCQKCYWKLQKQTFVTVPIFIPCNQVSLSTGEGYISDLKARFWQAERHTLGVSDVAYSWNMLFKTPFRIRNFILTLIVTQVYAMAAVIPWALLALGIQYKLVNNQAIHFFPMWVIDFLLNITPVFTGSSYVFYEIWKRKANKQVWKQQNDKLWRIIEYPLNFMVALFGMSVPAFLMASFAVLCQPTQYRVAEKRIDKNKQIEIDKNQPITSENRLKSPNNIQNAQKEKEKDEAQIKDKNYNLKKLQSYQNLRQTPKSASLGQQLDEIEMSEQVSQKKQSVSLKTDQEGNNANNYESGKNFMNNKNL